jgi:protein-tyrosine phosphatase
VRLKQVPIICYVVYNPKDTPNYQVDATKVILAQDLYTYDISKHFEEAYQFIDEQVQLGKNVLVHCHAGVSRSAALLAAYLIKSR